MFGLFIFWIISLCGIFDTRNPIIERGIIEFREEEEE